MVGAYKETSDKAQEKIKQIIFDHNLKEVDIAHAIGITPQAIHYQLHQSQNFEGDRKRDLYLSKIKGNNPIPKGALRSCYRKLFRIYHNHPSPNCHPFQSH